MLVRDRDRSPISVAQPYRKDHVRAVRRDDSIARRRASIAMPAIEHTNSKLSRGFSCVLIGQKTLRRGSDFRSGVYYFIVFVPPLAGRANTTPGATRTWFDLTAATSPGIITPLGPSPSVFPFYTRLKENR